MHVIAAGPQLLERSRLEAVFLARAANHGVEGDRLDMLALVVPVIGAVLADLQLWRRRQRIAREMLVKRLEHVSLEELKARILAPTEYLGGGAGLATNTQVLKQADAVALMALFAADYPPEVKRANWEFYDERTEQGSTLTPACAPRWLPVRWGSTDRAYDYFMNTATVDLAGTYKRYVGALYIGGTHPGANGRRLDDRRPRVSQASIRTAPGLPCARVAVALGPARIQRRPAGPAGAGEVTHGQVTITAAPANDRVLLFDVAGQLLACGPGLVLVVPSRPATAPPTAATERGRTAPAHRATRSARGL